MDEESVAKPFSYLNIKQSILLLLIVLLGQAGLGVVLGLILRSLSQQSIDPNAPSLVLLEIFLSLLSAGLVLLWMHRKMHWPCNKILQIKALDYRSLLPIILLMVGAGIVLAEVDKILLAIWPMPASLAEIFDSMMNQPTLYTMLQLVLIGPICEEFLFRSVILQNYLQQYSTKKAIIVSALLFGLAHMNPWQFVGGFIGGIILALLFIKYQSLSPAIIAHMLYNVVPFILKALGINIAGLSEIDFSSSTGFQASPLWLDILGLLLLFIGFYLQFRPRQKQ